MCGRDQLPDCHADNAHTKDAKLIVVTAGYVKLTCSRNYDAILFPIDFAI
jgi:hypothetical protein